MSKERYIAHVDMDAFFAAIEQRDNVRYRGKPVVVGADPKRGRGRGVVSTCSYEARKFGIHSAMPISSAYRRCPHAIFVPPDMEKYSLISRQIYKILYDFTPEVEPISVDEAFLDISGSFHLFGSPRKTCLLIKSAIKRETGLVASVGLAPTKMVAKIASDLEKPDGFVVVEKDKLIDFLRPLHVSKIWGLGKKTEAVLRNKSINTIGDLAAKSAKELEAMFGKNGVAFWRLSRGIDTRNVETGSAARSVSNEITFDKDTRESDRIESALMYLSEKVSGRLRQERIEGRTITLKIRLEGFKTFTRAVTAAAATNFEDMLYKEVKKLYNDFDRKGKRVRLVGVKVSNLTLSNPHSSKYRASLFEDNVGKRRENIHKAIDKIKGRFGDSSIQRAKSILSA
ncbi:MAG: DNA polymerase IV [Candidatus Omnitrophota bacterium]